MSSVSIKYSALKDAADEASTASKKLKSFAEEMDEAISKMQSLPGTDSEGYVNSALTLAKQKRAEANQQAERYSKLSTHITTFSNYAKKQDTNGVNAISRSVTDYVGEQSFWQKVGNAIHDSYVGFLDKIENLGPPGKLIAQSIRKGVTWLGNLKQDVVNWFKYGEGKYWLNIGKAIADIALKIAGVITAIGALATGPIGIVILGLVGVGLTFGNCLLSMDDDLTSIGENIKALGLYKNGDISAARYYGNIDGKKEQAYRYDYGDEAANIRKEKGGLLHDTGKILTGIGASLVNTATGFLKLGVTTDATTGQKIFDSSRFKAGFKQKILVDSGIHGNDYQDGFSLKKALGLDLFSGSNNKSVTDFFKNINTGRSKIITLKEAGQLIIGGGYQGYDSVKTLLDGMSTLPIIDTFTSDSFTLLDTLHNIGSSFTSYQTPSQRIEAANANGSAW